MSEHCSEYLWVSCLADHLDWTMVGYWEFSLAEKKVKLMVDHLVK